MDQEPTPREDTLEILSQAFDDAPIGMIVLRPDGTILRVNRLFVELSGLSHDELVAGAPGRHVHPDDWGATEAAMRRLARGESAVETLTMRLRPDGVDYRHFDATLRGVYGAGGRLSAMVGHLIDITQLHDVEHLAQQSVTDPVTGLPLIAVGQSFLGRHLRGQVDAAHQVAAVIVSLDHLPLFTARFGPQASDQVLAEVAARLTATAGPSELVASFGPDSFLVAAAGLGGHRDVEDLLRRVDAATEQPVVLDGQARRIDVSIGVATTDLPRRADALLQDATDAAGAARAQGGNTTVRATLPLRAAADRRREIVLALRAARENGQLTVHYQPVVDLQSNRLVGVECLLRWIRPEGRVSPLLFVPLAEESGDIIELGRWVAERVAADVASWTTPALGGIPIHLNVSTKQFRDADLAQGLIETWTGQRLDPQRLVIELTETQRIGGEDGAPQAVGDLHRSGVGLAIDDFGAGEAWFGQLGGLRPSILKLDTVFADQLAHHSVGAVQRASAVVTAGVALGAEVIAEGVSSAGLAAVFRRIGCTAGQGWFYSPALTSHDLEVYAGQ